MKKTVFRTFAVASVVVSMSFFAAGCAKKTVRTDEGAATAAEQAQPQAQPAVDRGPGEGMGKEESLASSGTQSMTTSAISEGRTSGPMLPVYFDFDRSNIRDDQKERIGGNAAYLQGNSAVNIRIEGNCDERGTNEYNMALGERRALSAKKYLLNMGIAESRLQTVSYGEEKPLRLGHDESDWSQNRRDDFVIQ